MVLVIPLHISRRGKGSITDRFYFLELSDCSHEIKRRLFFGRKTKTNLDSALKSRDITLPTKIYIVKAMGFSSSHVWMWELDYKEGWAPKNWCLWIVGLKTTLESLLDNKEIKPLRPKGNQPWIFIGRTDAEAAVPTLCLPNMKCWHIGKDPDAGKNWGQVEKGATEDEIIGWHHWLNGYEFEEALGDSGGQRSMACCSPWGCKELNTI